VNGYQQKQVKRALSDIPLKQLTAYELRVLTNLRGKYWLSEISEAQNRVLTEIMGKFA